jgi:hypothetical protein
MQECRMQNSNGMNPRVPSTRETQIPGQAPGNLTQKTHPLNPPLLPREGEAEGGGEFIKSTVVDDKVRMKVKK